MPTFSGRKNLTLLARSIGVPRTTVDAALAAGRAGRPGPRRLQGLLAGHEAAAGHRRGAAQESRPAHPRRAHERPRPGRHPEHPRADPRPGRVRGHGAAELAHPGRGAAGLPLGLHRRPRPAARLRDGSRTCSARRSPAPASAWPTRAGRQALPRGRGVRRDPRGRTTSSWRATSTPSRSPGCWPRRASTCQELTAVRPTLESFFLKLTGQRRRRRRPAHRDGGGAADAPRAASSSTGSAPAGPSPCSRSPTVLAWRPSRRDRLEHPPADRSRPRRRRGPGRPRGPAATGAAERSPPAAPTPQAYLGPDATAADCARDAGRRRPRATTRATRSTSDRCWTRTGSVLAADRRRADGHRRQHVRRRRLVLGLDDQPAGLRAAPRAGSGWPRRAPCMLGSGLVALVALGGFWLVAVAGRRRPRARTSVDRPLPRLLWHLAPRGGARHGRRRWAASR